MLESLSIKNLALIKEGHIEFDKGLNVLLGETGSGKSLIFDAIAFVIGQKTDKTLLRTGEKTMKVDALFVNLSDATKHILQEYEIEGDEILITRIFQEDGRSSFKINGEPVVSSMIKVLAKTLLDSLVQHESIELLKSKNHLLMLDKFGGVCISELKEKLIKKCAEKKEIENKISLLGGNSIERERTKDLISFQINEIEKADLQLCEDEEIKNRIDLLSNAEKIFEVASVANKCLSTDSLSVLKQMNEAINSLNSLSKIDTISECNERLISLRYDIEDISEILYDLMNSVNYDEIEYNRLDARNDQIKSLKKKYGASIEDILSYCDELKQKYDDIESSEENLQSLNKELNLARTELDKLAEDLSLKRKEIALKIESRVIKELVDLGMKNILFKVNFQDKNISNEGKDDVEFIFSANKGQDMKNLAKTASGGESSRLMLALKNIFADIDNIGTLLFDEVDSGISGEIGNMVADKLLNISKQTQVLCITHLPQVASLADSFYLVHKETVGNDTISNVEIIPEAKGIEEIARLIGGNNITDIALKHSLELRLRKKLL